MKHVLVPKHEKLTDEEIVKLNEQFSVDFTDLPRISAKDPALSGLDAKEGDIIRISRSSITAGTAIFYRGVIND